MNQFDSLMEKLIDFNQSFRSGIARNADNLPSIDYVQLFGTVRIDTGRMSGKSTWINKHADLHKALVVVSDVLVNDPLFESVSLKCTVDDVLKGHCNGWSYERIYVDCASYLLPTREDERRLIEALVTHSQQVVVLIG